MGYCIALHYAAMRPALTLMPPLVISSRLALKARNQTARSNHSLSVHAHELLHTIARFYAVDERPGEHGAYGRSAYA